MDKSKKRLIAFIIIILCLVLYFLWGFINNGTLSISGEVPFEVEVFGGKTLNCENSPCEIKLKEGEKDVIIRKEGFFNLVEVAEIKAFRKTDLSVEFSLVPKIEKISSIPFITTKKEYSLVQDGAGQKLISAEDSEKRRLAYFPKPIKNAQLFGNDVAVLVNSPTNTYKVDFPTNKKTAIELLPTITEGSFSRFGDYFVFESPIFEELWLLTPENETRKLEIKYTFAKTSWSSEGQLFYLNEIEEGYQLGRYNPKTDQYMELKIFSEITSLPDYFLVSPNEQIIYYTIGEENFQVRLK